MNQRRLNPTTLTAFTLLLLAAVTAQTATTTARPAPPPQICLGTACSQVAKKPSPSTPGTGIKWHPGHYGLSLSKSISASTASQVHADWAAMLNSDSHFVGVYGFYDWYHLEPTAQGGYDFSSIDNDIAWLNANFPGKKLLIEVWSRNFCQSTALPTVPQDPNARCTKVPDYIMSGAFTGSGGNPGATWNKNGLLAAYWSGAVMARLQALDAALAARYDNNPTVEAIRYDEYSPPGPLPGAPALGYSQGAAVSAWNALHATMAADWVHTNKANHANFPASASGRPDNGLFAYLQSIKVGVGGPDILPPLSQGGCCGGESWGAQILRGAGSNFGTTDYRGTVPIIYEAENPGWPMDAAELESYAYNTLQATHVGWVYNPSNIGGGSWTPGTGSTPWTTASPNANGNAGILDTLRANGFRIHAACPTVYNGNCNTN